MKPGDVGEVDDPVRMIGPSYRGTANRGTENRGTENRGIERRGIENRGIERRGIENRGATVASLRQQSPGGPSSGAPARSTGGRLSAWFDAGRTRAADQARAEANRARAAAQAQAEAIHDAQRPFFDSAFRRHVRKNTKLGRKVPIAVLEREAFDALLALRNRTMSEQFIAALVRQRPDYVQRRLETVVKSGGVLAGKYPSPITPTTKIHPRDALLIDPPPMSGRPGAFYDPDRGVIVRVDQVDAGIIAHETCHAYTSAAWNEMLTTLIVHRVEPGTTELDEGVTSEKGNLVLFEQARATATSGAGRPIAHADAYAGYAANVQARAGQFLLATDGAAGTPGPNAIAAYFDGVLRFVVDPRDPMRSQLRIGTKTVSMQVLA